METAKSNSSSKCNSPEDASLGQVLLSAQVPARIEPGKQASKRTGPKYRTGKWTEEETKYASQMIRCFGLGVLKLPTNKTLRTYLSGELDCDPMRVTKKFPGTALLMKELSDDSKPEPQQSVVQNELLKLESLQQSFCERLHYDQLKQGSRPSVFSLVDGVEPPKGPSPTVFAAPASADIVVPPTKNGNASGMQTPGMNNAAVGMNSVARFSGVVSQGEQHAVPTTITSANLGFLLSNATPGSPLAVALTNPMILPQLWKIQEQQEQQMQNQRAVLMQLGSSGFAPTVRSVTPPMNNVGQAPAGAPQAVVPMNHPASLFLNNCFSVFPQVPTLQPSHSAPNLQTVTNFYTPKAPPPVATTPNLQPPGPAPSNTHVPNNSPFYFNSLPSATAAPLVGNATSHATTPVLHGQGTPGVQANNPMLPGWLTTMTSNVRTV